MYHQKLKIASLIYRIDMNKEKELKANKSSAVAEMGNRLATTDMGRKLGEGCAPFGGKLGPN